MNKLLLLAAACILAWPSQTPEDKPVRNLEMDHQELLNLESETVRALQLNNATFFRRVYSDDFIATTASGQSIDKATLLNNIQTSAIKYDSFVCSDLRVRIYEDTAVVNSFWSARGSFRGQRFSKQSRVIHVYIYGQHGWHAVASQETPLPGEGN